MELIKAECMGFCQGVKKAISLVEKVSRDHEGETVYVYGELAHNKYVLESIRALGTVTVHDAEDVPDGAPVVLRAHGISDEKRNRLIAKGCRIYDATCPLVLQNQILMRNSDLDVLLVGIPGHSETVAVEGAARKPYILISGAEDIEKVPRDREYLVIVQTTFATDKLDRVMKKLEELGIRHRIQKTICHASTERREALRKLTEVCDVIFVAGDRMSANSNALVEEAKRYGVDSYLIESPEEVAPRMKEGYRRIGLCAGSSTPDEAIENVARRIEEL